MSDVQRFVDVSTKLTRLALGMETDRQTILPGDGRTSDDVRDLMRQHLENPDARDALVTLARAVNDDSVDG